jgi:hypothetical protein
MVADYWNSANGHAAASNRKTINPQDVLNALDDLEFLGFRERLEPEIESMLGP